MNTWKHRTFTWRKLAAIVLETHLILCTSKRLHWHLSTNIGMNQLTVDLWSIRLWSARFLVAFTWNTFITEASSCCRAHVDFHPFQHMSLVLMAKTFMPKLKGYWSRCNVNFRWLSRDHGAHVHGVCVCHPPACYLELTVALKHNPLRFYDDSNSMFCRTPYREVSSHIGNIPHVFQTSGAPLPLPAYRY